MMYSASNDDSRGGPRSEREVRDERTRTRLAQLRRRGLDLQGGETDAEMAMLIDAAERFESAVAALGDAPERPLLGLSSPDPSSVVIPPRAADESVKGYADRLTRLAARLRALGDDH